MDCLACERSGREPAACGDCGGGGRLLLPEDPSDCGQCAARLFVPCQYCSDSHAAERFCPDCPGAGSVPCEDCRGLTKVICASCQGSTELRSNRGGGTCKDCKKGLAPCRSCRDGVKRCETCLDRTHTVPCAKCEGDQKVPCTGCRYGAVRSWSA